MYYRLYCISKVYILQFLASISQVGCEEQFTETVSFILLRHPSIILEDTTGRILLDHKWLGYSAEQIIPQACQEAIFFDVLLA